MKPLMKFEITDRLTHAVNEEDAMERPKWFLINCDDAIRALLSHRVITESEAKRMLARQGYSHDEVEQIVKNWEERSDG